MCGVFQAQAAVGVGEATDRLREGLRERRVVSFEQARLRLQALQELARENPREALAQSLKREELAALVAAQPELAGVLERPLNQVAKVFSVCGLGEHRHGESEELAAPQTQLLVELEDRLYRATSFGGGAQWQNGRKPVKGVLVGELVVLDEDPVERLEGGPALRALVGGREYTFADEQELGSLRQRLQSQRRLMDLPDKEVDLMAAQRGGLQPLPVLTNTAQVTGEKRIVILRVDFSDKPGDPAGTPSKYVDSKYVYTTYTHAYAEAMGVELIDPFFKRSSYGKLSTKTTSSPTLYRMAQPMSYYNKDHYHELYTEAKKAYLAENPQGMGDKYVIVCDDKTPIGAAGWGGGDMVVESSLDDRVTLHELGHCWGLMHAGSATTPAGNPFGPPLGYSEYGDTDDIMGNGYYWGDYSSALKRRLSWITDADIHVLKKGESGVFRIQAYDQHNYEAILAADKPKLAIRIPRDSNTDIWIDIRRFAVPSEAGKSRFSSSYPQKVDSLNATRSSIHLLHTDYTLYQSSMECQFVNVDPETNWWKPGGLKEGASVIDYKTGLKITTERNGEGALPYADIRIEWLETPPVYVGNPGSGIFALTDKTCSLMAAAESPEALSYQWESQNPFGVWSPLKDGGDFAGCSSATLVVSRPLGHTEPFRVRVSNKGTANTSGATRLYPIQAYDVGTVPLSGVALDVSAGPLQFMGRDRAYVLNTLTLHRLRIPETGAAVLELVPGSSTYYQAMALRGTDVVLAHSGGIDRYDTVSGRYETLIKARYISEVVDGGDGVMSLPAISQLLWLEDQKQFLVVGYDQLRLYDPAANRVTTVYRGNSYLDKSGQPKTFEYYPGFRVLWRNPDGAFRLRGASLQVQFDLSTRQMTEVALVGDSYQSFCLDETDGTLLQISYNGAVRYTPKAELIQRIGTAGTQAKDGDEKTATFNAGRMLSQAAEGLWYVLEKDVIRPVRLRARAQAKVLSYASQGLCGESVVLGVTQDAAFSYQWLLNDQLLDNRTATQTLRRTQSRAGNLYSVRVTETASGVETVFRFDKLLPPSSDAQLSNLSARALTGKGENALIVGYSLRGKARKTLLVRGVGPTLKSFGLSNALTSLKTTVYDAKQLPLASNERWGGSETLQALFDSLGAFSLAKDSGDTALRLESEPSQFSAMLEALSTPGVAIAEIYDTRVQVSSERLVNLSARSQVGQGEQALYAGFVVQAGPTNSHATLLIRGVGPKLRSLGLSSALKETTLVLHDAKANDLASNSGWTSPVKRLASDANLIFEAASKADMDAVGAFGLDAGSLDSAMLVTLPPGLYSVELKGLQTGVGLIEIYDMNP